MSGAVIELIPFKVEVSPLKDLISDEQWELIEQKKLSIEGNFLMRLGRSMEVSYQYDLYKKKMVDHPFRKALEVVYTLWRERYFGEWIVVGKIGEYYLAAQPKKVAAMLPMECCRFVGLL